MNEATEREMERLRRLIEQEAQAGLDRFHQRDFRAAWEKRLHERLRQKRSSLLLHPVVLALGAAALLLLAGLLSVYLPFVGLKRDIREIRELLMRMPEMGTSLAALSPAPADDETKMRMLLTWIFKQADDRLNPREMSVAEVRSLLEKAASAPGPEQVSESHPGTLSREELLLMEKKIRALIVAGELQRRRPRDGTDHL